MEDSSKSTRNFSTSVDEGFSLNSVAGVVFGFMYTSTFFTSCVGNSLVLVICFRSRRGGSAFTSTGPLFNLHIASLSVADVLFTFLTVFDVVYVIHGEWIMGEVLCRLQGFLLETCYSASILTLVAISRERLKSASEIEMKSRAHKARERKTSTIIVWTAAILLCSPLLYAYTVQEREDKIIRCDNIAWLDIGRQVYYSLAAVILFLFPLAFMTQTHLHIRAVFKTQVVPNERMIASIRTRQKKATKMLRTVTLVFLCLWAPFIIVRTLKYFYLYNGFVFWKMSQLLALINVASNPFIYSFYSSQFRNCFKSVLNCCCVRTPMFSVVNAKSAARRTSLPSAYLNSLM